MKRLISLVISLCLCLSIIPAAVFADTSDEGGGSENVCDLLVIGDSTTTGYGLPDDIPDNSSFAIGNTDLEGSWTYEKAVAYNEDPSHPVRGRMSNISYPWQLKKYIESLDGVSRCDFSTMCVDGTISSSLRAMLDPSYYEREIAKEARIMGEGNGPVGDQIGKIKKYFYNGGAIEKESYTALHNYAVNEVKNADVIVLDANTNDIALYMFRRISGLMGVSFLGGQYYYKERVSDLENLTDKRRSSLKVIREELMEVAGKPDDPLVDGVIDTIMYCYANSVTNFSENVKMIRELNPDAKIIVPSLFNGLAGISMTIGNTGVDISDMYEILVQGINTNIKALDENSSNYYMADVPIRIHTINSEFQEAESLDEFIKSEYGQSYLNFLYGQFGSAFSPDGKKEEHKEDIKTLFVEAICNYPIDLAVLNGLDMRKSIAELMTYYQTKAMPSDGTMMLLHLMAALLLVHPSSVGCTQKFEAARDALSKDHTAYEEVLIDVVDAVKAAASKAGINSIDDLKKLAALKDLASLITKEDLLKIAQSIYDLPDLEAQIEQYMDEHSGEDAGKTEDRIASLEAQINDLTAIIEKLTQEAKKKESALAKAKIKTVKPAKKALTVKWKAVTNASGYQVYYKASGKKAVIKTVKGAKKLTLKLTGLKKKAKYTVKVRAYKTASVKTTYGKWSAAKKARTK